MFKLIHYAKSYYIQIILGSFFKFMEAVLELFLPLLLARLIDNGINQNDSGYIIQIGWIMFGLSLIGLLFAIGCQYFSSIAAQGWGTILRNTLFKKIHSLSHKDIDFFGVSTLITRTTNDVNQIQLALAMTIRLALRAPFLGIGSLILSFYINPTLSLIFLILLPTFALTVYLIMTKTIPLYKKVQKKVDTLTEIVGENLSGVRVIRAFAKSKYEQKRSTEVSDQLAKAYIRVNTLSALVSPVTTLIMNLGIIAILYIGATQVNQGIMMQGEVLALINYISQMLSALMIAANLIVIYTKANASATRVNEVLDTTPSIIKTAQTNSGHSLLTEEATYAISFNKVDFSYDEKGGKDLKAISFHLEKGKTLGIIGATGSGKSTLIHLIPRFYDASSGDIQLFGKTITSLKTEALHENIRIVSQNERLMAGTVASNLKWGKGDADEAAMWKALDIAQIGDFIRDSEEQLEMEVREGGNNFSGGQRQRLAIAKALVKKPAILILDDSLSALDYATESRLMKQLHNHFKETTLVIVSQRISSIQSADHLIVMDNGRVDAQGSHDSLLSHSDVYKDIYISQTSGPDVKEDN